MMRTRPDWSAADLRSPTLDFGAVVMGEEVRNVEALANAEALDHFRGIPALEED